MKNKKDERMQIMIIMRHHYIPTRLTKIKKTDNTKCFGGCGVMEIACSAVEM